MHSSTTLLSSLQGLSLMQSQPCLLAPRPATEQYWQSTTCSTSEEAEEDKLAVMRRLEVSRYLPKDYLKMAKTEGRFRQRRMTVEYLYQVVDFGGFQRDVVAYSVCHLMDRFLATPAGEAALRDSNRFQLVALTCLYMAVKMLEAQNIGVDSLVPLANGVYSRHDFLEMEREILQALDWYVAQGPTPLAFVQLLMPLLPEVEDMDTLTLYNHAQYQLELAISDYNLSRALPSDLAVVALWNALDSMDHLSLEEAYDIQQTVLSALQYGSEETALLEIRIEYLQNKLRQLMLATYSWTTSSLSRNASFAAVAKANQQQEGNQSPVAVAHKDGDSPSTPAAHTTFGSVSHVDLLRLP